MTEMHWLIRPFKPKTYNWIFTALLILILVLMIYLISQMNKDTYEFYGVVLTIWAVGGILIGCVAMAYWSIINKIGG